MPISQILRALTSTLKQAHGSLKMKGAVAKCQTSLGSQFNGKNKSGQ